MSLPVTIGTKTVDIHTLPHLLIGGMVGSGKSTLIHSFLTSLISANSPERLRFILCDYKQVELDMYNDLPHLLTPVISDSRKTILALKWLNKEIDRRYGVLQEEKLRSIDAYHTRLKNLIAKGAEELTQENMSFIVVVIDEISEPLTTYPREIESTLSRIAQFGAQVGVHMILSTSNSSSKVLTNSIRMNIPARLAFQVLSDSDSRSILGFNGAENLRGEGNALYTSRDMTEPMQLQTEVVGEEKILNTVMTAARTYKADSENPVILPQKNYWDSVFSTVSPEDEDDLYPEVERVVREAGKASTAYIQRKLGIGYARAAKLIDLLETRGVIEEADGSKPRKVIEG